MTVSINVKHASKALDRLQSVIYNGMEHDALIDSGEWSSSFHWERMDKAEALICRRFNVSISDIRMYEEKIFSIGAYDEDV